MLAALFLRDEVFVAILARYAAHLPLAAVTGRGVTRVQPMKPEWDAPKAVIYEREFQARKAAREAATVAA